MPTSNIKICPSFYTYIRYCGLQNYDRLRLCKFLKKFNTSNSHTRYLELNWLYQYLQGYQCIGCITFVIRKSSYTSSFK